MKKIFEVHQKITPLANIYKVLDPEKLEEEAFVRQKRFALRERFDIYTDESQTQSIAYVKANKVIDLAAGYLVMSDMHKPLGSVRKLFKKSLLNSSWALFDDDQMKHQVFSVREKSQLIAILRRLWQLIPISAFNLIPFPFKFHFVIIKDSNIVGEYTKLTIVRDHYALYLEDAVVKDLDQRVWMALAVLLDALEGR